LGGELHERVGPDRAVRVVVAGYPYCRFGMDTVRATMIGNHEGGWGVPAERPIVAEISAEAAYQQGCRQHQ
jgi:hypothetical protein